MNLRVVLAPDSLKGGPTAHAVAVALATGWHRHRPQDCLVCLPMADGGEGTLDAVASATDHSSRHAVPNVCGPDGVEVTGEYLMTPDRIAVVDLATASGLPLMARPDPLCATTLGTGQVVRAALEAGAERIVLGVGGSASTDGGTGILRALGARFLDAAGHELPLGGGALARLATVDTSQLVRPPAGSVEVLVDVDRPLVGPQGAAHTFGPQKGATEGQVGELEAALTHLAAHLDGDPNVPGMGAAGGTPFGLQALWGARVRDGARFVATAIGLRTAVQDADCVVTAEGTFDRSSLQGKVVGHVTELARATSTSVALVAGQIRHQPPDEVRWHASLSELAGSVEASMGRPKHYLEKAGEVLTCLVDRVCHRTERMPTSG